MIYIFMPEDQKVKNKRLEKIIDEGLEELWELRHRQEVVFIKKAEELCKTGYQNSLVIFALSLDELGCNLEYYKFLQVMKSKDFSLEGSIATIFVDGQSQLYTKEVGREIGFTLNMSGARLVGKALIEATDNLYNFTTLSKVIETDLYSAYKIQSFRQLIKTFDAYENKKVKKHRYKVLALYTGQEGKSNSLRLWQYIKEEIEEKADIEEISLRNGKIADCRGCTFEKCLYYGEQDSCFYGGFMVNQVYPAILECDKIILVCPNYNDALGANLTAVINRLTALVRKNALLSKEVYAVIVSGYSGGDIVAKQIMGALNFNKSLELPPRFALMETANLPLDIDKVEGAKERARAFALQIIE